MSRGVTFRATKRWIDRPLRTCGSMHHCSVCDKAITIGQRYFDGGHGKRAHEACVDVEAEKAAHAKEQEALGAVVRALRADDDAEVPDYSKPKFSGGCMGVDLEPRGDKDQHIMITLCVEDDESWHRKLSVSSFWLDELIEVLQEAQTFCKTQKPDMKDGMQFGWRFKRAKGT